MTGCRQLSVVPAKAGIPFSVGKKWGSRLRGNDGDIVEAVMNFVILNKILHHLFVDNFSSKP